MSVHDVFLGHISRVDVFVTIQYVLGTICVVECNVYCVMYVLLFIG